MDQLIALRNAGIEQPAYELSLIYEEVTSIPAAEARLNPPILNEPQQAHFTQILMRRIKREPLHRIFGWREFWGLRFRLSPATLEPRPDSETLIEALLKHLPNRTAPLHVLDLGTGTGCLLLSVLNEYQYAQGVGIDISPLAISTAAANAKSINLATRAQFQLGNWEKSNWLNLFNNQKFDLIISNPPYIETTAELSAGVRNHDPHTALFAGADGLAAYRIILAGLPRLLAENGIAVIELGAGQAAAVRNIATNNSLQIIDICRDLGGHERCLVLRHAVV